MPNKLTEKEFRRRLASAENMAVRQRNYRRARDRALARLAQKYKEEYLELLAEEKEKDEKEGKRWHNLAGSSLDTWLVSAEQSTDTSGGDTSDIPQDKGDNV